MAPALPHRASPLCWSAAGPLFRPSAGGDTAGADTVVATAAPEASPARPSAAAGKADPAPAAPTPRPSGPAERVYAFTTRIPFAWDSARLAPEAHRLLDTLAEVLQDGAMADKVIRIGSCTWPLRIIALSRKPDTMPPLHSGVTGPCHDSAPFLLPPGDPGAPVGMDHAILYLAQPMRCCTAKASRAAQTTTETLPLPRAHTV